MRDSDQGILSIDLGEDYLMKHPSLHREDSVWKFNKIIRLVDMFATLMIGKRSIRILDVGGGAGMILSQVARHLRSKHGIEVTKLAVDLSPGMLAVQKEQNPDIIKALNEDIRRTSLEDKEVDLTLAIDVLEHVPEPVEALRELKRISHFAILKVPLENNLVPRLWNLLTRGNYQRHLAAEWGHINYYSFYGLRRQVSKHVGKILYHDFSNVHSYSLSVRAAKTFRSRIADSVGALTFRLSPSIASGVIFSDFAVLLVESS